MQKLAYLFVSTPSNLPTQTYIYINMFISFSTDLKIKVTELEHRLQAQEKDIKNQMNKFNETQSQLDKAKRDLADKERGLTKSKDDLAKMTTQHEQAVAKVTRIE